MGSRTVWMSSACSWGHTRLSPIFQLVCELLLLRYNRPPPTAFGIVHSDTLTWTVGWWLPLHILSYIELLLDDSLTNARLHYHLSLLPSLTLINFIDLQLMLANNVKDYVVHARTYSCVSSISACTTIRPFT